MGSRAAAKLPEHIAIVMDGNGRWAKARGLPRQLGHRKGAENMRPIIEACLDLGIPYLTLFAFSTENWKRPASEVNYLMSLPRQFYDRERHLLHEHQVRVIIIGDVDGLPASTREVVLRMQAETKDYRALTLCLAFNYGGRAELVRAAEILARKWQAGELNEITEADVADVLYTREFPDPDLVIRCGNEMRISNFLLWQSAYAELYFSQKLWPDFNRQDLEQAIHDFAQRGRRFGGLTMSNGSREEER
ncbi:MAG: isoprenyl transferase [Firmicutes bacterium]|nr:isoprenyl transferase [Bacillota bacterium]